MKKENLSNEKLEEKIKELVCQSAEAELIFWDNLAGEDAVPIPALPDETVAALERSRHIRQGARWCGAAAAVLAVLLLVGNFDALADGARWVQERVKQFFAPQEETLLPDTENTEEATEAEGLGTDGTEAVTETEGSGQGGKAPVGTIYSGEYELMGSELWLPEIGQAGLAHEEHEDIVLYRSGDGQILSSLGTRTDWEYENKYRDFRCFAEDYDGDDRTDLLIAEISSDEAGRTSIRGELLTGQAAGGFASSGTFTDDTGLVLGYEPASLRAGYEMDGLSIAWAGQEISLIYQDRDSTQASQCESFYAWSTDGGASWERAELSDLTVGMDWGTAALTSPVWHRDFEGGRTVAVFEGDVLAVVRWTRDDLAENSLSVAKTDPKAAVDYMSGQYGVDQVTEAVFVSEERGFLAFRYWGDAYSPRLLETRDGGSTWEFMDLGLEDGGDGAESIWDTRYLYGEVYAVRREGDVLVADVLMHTRDERKPYEILTVSLP